MKKSELKDFCQTNVIKKALLSILSSTIGKCAAVLLVSVFMNNLSVLAETPTVTKILVNPPDKGSKEQTSTLVKDTAIESLDLQIETIQTRKWIMQNSLKKSAYDNFDNKIQALESQKLAYLNDYKSFRSTTVGTNKHFITSNNILDNNENFYPSKNGRFGLYRIKNNPVSSGYGYRIHPVTGKFEFHNGIDIPMKEGTPIYAYSDGIVETVEYRSYANNAGKYIAIIHKEGYETLYLHLSKVLVYNGQLIKKGELLGLSGSTGRTTGPHLHFEIKRNGIAINPENIGMLK